MASPGDLRRSGRVDDDFGPEHDRLRRVALQIASGAGDRQGRVTLGVVHASASLRGLDGPVAHSAGSCEAGEDRGSAPARLRPRVLEELPLGRGLRRLALVADGLVGVVGVPTGPVAALPVPVAHLLVGVSRQPCIHPPWGSARKLVVRGRVVVVDWGRPGLVVLLGLLLLLGLVLLPVEVGAPWVARHVSLILDLRSFGPLAGAGMPWVAGCLCRVPRRALSPGPGVLTACLAGSVCAAIPAGAARVGPLVVLWPLPPVVVLVVLRVVLGLILPCSLGGFLRICWGLPSLLLLWARGNVQGPVEPLAHGWFLVVIGSAQVVGPLLLGLLEVRVEPGGLDVVLHEGFHIGGPLGTTVVLEDGGSRKMPGKAGSLTFWITAGLRP